MTWRLNILLVVTIWVMVANQSLHAQELRSVRGIVMDSVTRKAIENVTVVINGKSLYAITNTEGHFEFHFPRQYAQDTLVFSCVGYKAKQVPLKSIGDDITVTLPESKVILSELIVSPTDELKVKAIIQRAMESIKNNFADTVIISGYFKKYQKVDDHYVSYLDAAVYLYDKTFSQADPKKQPEMISVNAVRKSHNLRNKGYNNWVDDISDNSNWLARLLSRNDVRYRNGLLEARNKFRLVGYTTYREKTCYEIEVSKKPWHYVKPTTDDYQGLVRLIIDADNFMIYKIIDREYANQASPVKNIIWTRKINDTLSAGMIGGEKILQFNEYKGRLYVSYIAEKILVGDYDPKTEDVVHRNEYFWEFFCNEILREVPTKDKFAVGKVDDMKMNLTQYDPLFWKRYNQIPESGETQKAFQDLSVAGDIEDQFRKSSDEMTRPH